MSKIVFDKPFRVYSDVVACGYILPRRKVYNIRDLRELLAASSESGYGLSVRQAAFIVKCRAIFHGTTWARTICKFSANASKGL